MKKIIFIYGYKGYSKQSRIAKKILNNYELICFEYNSNLVQTIEDIAKELSDFINKNTKSKEQVNLIGISAGGVIAEYYTKFTNPKKINKVATICSPLNGTYLARFYSKKSKGLKQLSNFSAFLKKFNSKKLGKSKIINFWCRFDPLVPGKSGKGENSIHIKNFFHFTIQDDKRIFKKIKEFFEL